MTPIIKNIRVVDKNGNELESTYPKRADGLVRKGRARFIDENTICLTCPHGETEIIEMDNSIELSYEYMLTQIEKIRNEQKDFNEKVMLYLESARESVDALIHEHDEANKRITNLYQQILDQMCFKSPEMQEAREKFLEFVLDTTRLTGEDDNCTPPDYEKIWKIMTQR